jgi:transposase-like protein
VSTETEDLKAQQRQQIILAHLEGRINATQAAQAMGTSRKTFYAWLDRARAGMLAALADRPTGRPPQPVDPQKEALQAELDRQAKEHRILEGRLRIQEAILEVLEKPPGAAKKKGAM